MTNYIKRWWEQSKAKTQADNITHLRNSFYLKEKNGSVWIMHDGVAIDKVYPCTSSDDVVKLLNEARNYAVEYAIGKEGK